MRSSALREGVLLPPSAVLLLLLVTPIAAAQRSDSGADAAAAILRQAEEIRSPALDFAVEFKISVHDPKSSVPDRTATYSMIAHGKDHAMVLMKTPPIFYGGTLLVSDGQFWLLLPKASKAFQLSAEQVLKGDIALGDLARSNLVSDFEPHVEGEERIDSETCWQLELKRTRNTARYSRIRYWITKKGNRPKKLEYYGLTGALMRIARYSDFEKGTLGLRPMTLIVEDATGTDQTSTLVFSSLRPIRTTGLVFTPEGMAAFRDAALASKPPDGAPLRTEDLLAALHSARP